MTLDELMAFTVERSQEAALAVGGMPPAMFMGGAAGPIWPPYLIPKIPSGFRPVAVRVLRLMLEANDATAYVVAFEAWTRDLAVDDPEVAKITKEGLEGDPKAIETAVYTGCDRERGQMRSFTMTRDQAGKLVGFEPRQTFYDADFDRNSPVESWMIGLLW